MIEILVAAEDVSSLKERLLGAVEGCAILFANSHTRSDGLSRLIVADIAFPGQNDYLRRGYAEAQLTPDFVARITKIGRTAKQSIIFVHSHPGLNSPQFSLVDDEGERILAAFLSHRHPHKTHAAIVLSKGGWSARRLGSLEAIRLVSIGTNRDVLFDPTYSAASELNRYDRQVRAFGAPGQKEIEKLRVAIIGLGGTGSLISQQLAHLGVSKFTLIDADVLEESNLNRVCNATADDVGRPKVDIAADYITRVNPFYLVNRIEGDVTRSSIANALLDVDLMFGCTDSHGSRAILQQIAYQYFIPLIDMGTTITVLNGEVAHVFGRVQLLSPGIACFACSNLIDPNEVRRDLMSEFERRADPYMQGAREPAPAVMSLNGTVTSLAGTMFLAMIAGIPSLARYLLYNAKASSLRPIKVSRQSDCYICSPSGALAKADSWPLMARQD